MDIMKVNIERFTYQGAEKSSLHDIHFAIAPGKLVVLTGNSGCGKTTLTRVMNGLIPDQYEGTLDGKVTLLDQNLHDFKTGTLAKVIGNVFQNPSDQFFTRFLSSACGMPRFSPTRATSSSALRVKN